MKTNKHFQHINLKYIASFKLFLFSLLASRTLIEEKSSESCEIELRKESIFADNMSDARQHKSLLILCEIISRTQVDLLHDFDQTRCLVVGKEKENI